MAIESFSFDKGINRKKSPLFLDEGELYSCSGFSFEHDGVLEARMAKTQGKVIDTKTTSKINGIHRYDDSIYASSRAYCPGNQVFFNYIYHRLVSGSYSLTSSLPLANQTRPRFADYNKFTFIVDGNSKKAYVENRQYEWGIENPKVAPTTDTPGTTEYCYVTFYVQFPNDKVVETGPSPGVGTTGVVTITWSGIPICQYEGDDLIIHRRLYRTVSGIPYLVTTLADNITQTYSDSVSDEDLQASTILGTEDYLTPPIGPEDIAVYLQRVFLIKENKLYYTDVYSPFAFLSEGEVITKTEGENLIGIINWADQLYMASMEEWYRLQGTDPDTWAVKRTFTDNGINNRDTLKKSKYGLIGSWHDGIYLFDGSMSRNITERILGKDFFKNLDYTAYFADFDGIRYYFYYASSGTTIDNCIVIDFTHYPDLRIYQNDFLVDAEEFNKQSNHKYLAKNGYEYSEEGTETIPISLITGDKAFGAIIKRKCLDYLFYDINTNGKDVSVAILVDGTIAQTLILNTSSRERKRSNKLTNIEGYRFTLQITCADFQNASIYAPWVLEATPVGE